MNLSLDSCPWKSPSCLFWLPLPLIVVSNGMPGVPGEQQPVFLGLDHLVLLRKYDEQITAWFTAPSEAKYS